MSAKIVVSRQMVWEIVNLFVLLSRSWLRELHLRQASLKVGDAGVLAGLSYRVLSQWGQPPAVGQ